MARPPGGPLVLPSVRSPLRSDATRSPPKAGGDVLDKNPHQPQTHAWDPLRMALSGERVSARNGN
jgi:hypothetical protein